MPEITVSSTFKATDLMTLFHARCKGCGQLIGAGDWVACVSISGGKDRYWHCSELFSSSFLAHISVS